LILSIKSLQPVIAATFLKFFHSKGPRSERLLPKANRHFCSHGFA